jgi:hypothetical protein
MPVNRYFYVKLLLSRTLDFCYAFCGTGITVGAQYATLTVQAPKKNTKYIRVIEILLALILVDGQGTITSEARTFVVLQLVTNVALIEYT